MSDGLSNAPAWLFSNWLLNVIFLRGCMGGVAAGLDNTSLFY